MKPLLALLLLSTPAFASPPTEPHYPLPDQSSDSTLSDVAPDLIAILNSPEVLHRAGRGEFRGIVGRSPNYSVGIGNCTLSVTMRYIGAPMPGGPVHRQPEVSGVHCAPGGVSVGNQ